MKRWKSWMLLSALLLSPLSGCQNQTDKIGETEEEDSTKDGLKEPDPSKVIADFVGGEEITGSEVTTDTVRFHYHRTDNNDGTFQVYRDYFLWVWDVTNQTGGAWYKFDHYDSFGVYRDIKLTDVATKPTRKIGFIVAFNDWSKKDVESDRYVEIKSQAKGGIQEVYLKTQTEQVFDNAQSVFQSTMKYARLDSSSRKRIVISFQPNEENFLPDVRLLSVIVNGKELTNVSLEKFDSSSHLATFLLPKDIELEDVVKVAYQFGTDNRYEVSLMITSYFDSEEFKAKYVYEGKDLGVTFDDENTPTTTTFKVWAPTSSEITLNLYDTGDYLTETTPKRTIKMNKGEKGIYSASVKEDLDGKYYTYQVTNSLGTNEVVDPYAKSAGLNGKRGMILNFTRLNQTLEGWNEDVRPDFGTDGTDASIYEIHIRDMTINPNSGVSEEKRGKYLGLAEEGTTYTENETTVTTGLDHLKELGITHVQIQPFYDYSSVDESLDNKEMSDTNYNWGYDPLNYNCLEGSYSSDPKDGAARVKEFKTMVMAMHKAGININMDVVYNHMSSLNGSNFQLLVPNYYFRMLTSGKIYNGSGCGNEVASERAMVHKFILDSTTFWTQEYHLSGFRFDLMGLLDNQTMIDIYDANKALYAKVMIYGEPWTGGTSKLKSGTDKNSLSSQQTVQASLGQSYFAGSGKYVGAFNDIIRNAIRGDNSPSKGYVQGMSSDASTILKGIQGTFSGDSVEPQQVLNYVSCHDNYTLYDQLVQTTTRDVTDLYSQAESIVFLSQGVPFLQEGEDFLRSKNYQEDGKQKYSGNSYNVGDSINDMDYSLKVENLSMFNKFKELIQLRKSLPQLRLKTRSEIQTQLKDLQGEKGNIRYCLEGEDTIQVLHSLNGETVELDGTYDVLYRNKLGSSYSSQVTSITLGSNESVVLRRVKS